MGIKASWVHGIGWVTGSIFLLLGPFLGWITFRAASRVEQQSARMAFETHMSERAALLQKEVYDITEDLHHVRAFISAQGKMTRADFRTFTRDILEGNPAIHALEWAPRVAASRREEHERSARAEGFQGYRIRMQAPQGKMVPAPPQKEYYPVLYVEPFGPNERKVGFDISSDPVRKAALTLAAKTQKITLTDPVDLELEPGSPRGVLALVPVYRETRARRSGTQVQLEGFVVFVLGAQDIVEESLLLGGGPPRVRFQLVDNDVAGKTEVIDSSPDWENGSARGGEVFVRSIVLGGQAWQLLGQPTEAFLSGYLTRLPLALGIGVFLFWEALSGLGLFYSKWSRDHALRKQDRIFGSVWRSLTEGVVVAGTDGKFLLFNDCAQKILGIGLKDVSPSEWSSTYGCYYPDTQTPFPSDRLPLARAMRGEEVREEEIFIRNPRVPAGVWISVGGSPLVDEDGASAGGVVVFRDISERRKQQQALERLYNVVEQTADTVFITNRDGMIEYVNPAFEATTGYSRAEALGNSPRILKSGKYSPGHYQELWKTLLNGEVYRSTITNRKKNGDMYQAEQTITPMKDSEGRVTHFVSLLKDVTERIRTEEREIEMHYAAMVQKKLYPEQPPQLEGFDIAGAVFPAEATCGDYFDYLDMSNGALGIVIGDVCGHGLGPALIMSETRAFVRSLCQARSEFSQILDPVNKWLHADLESGSFVTLLLTYIDAPARRLVYTNAGHPPGYLLDRSGALKAVLNSTGFPLGLFPNSTYGDGASVEFGPGDLVVLLTDGITESEAPDGSAFEGERVLEVIRAHQDEPAEHIVLHVRRALWDFTEGMKPADDLTIVVCKATPPD